MKVVAGSVLCCAMILWSAYAIARSRERATDAEAEFASIVSLANERAAAEASTTGLILSRDASDVVWMMEDVLERAGLPREVMLSAAPTGDMDTRDGIVRAHGAVVLEGVTLAEVGRTFSAMRNHHGAWRAQSIRITPLEPGVGERTLRIEISLDVLGLEGEEP
jgi:hypothetical protein